jgi:hypothetical protein
VLVLVLVLDFRPVSRLPASKIEDEHEHDNEHDLRVEEGGIPSPASLIVLVLVLVLVLDFRPVSRLPASKIEDEHEHDNEHDLRVEGGTLSCPLNRTRPSLASVATQNLFAYRRIEEGIKWDTLLTAQASGGLRNCQRQCQCQAGATGPHCRSW